MTSRTSIALNRFGYGLALGDNVPSDPVRYLRGQMDAFDPAPLAIRTREDMSAKPGEILELIRTFRRQRQSRMAETGEDRSTAMRAIMEGSGANDPLAGLPPELRSSYMRAGRWLRRDVGLRTNVAIASETPFIERLVHFWSNHFSVSAQKPGTHYLVAGHEFDAIRPNVLGTFSDMLKAAVLHPAMLMYLDQFGSIGPNSRFMQSRQGMRRRRNGGVPRGLNENLAREIMELHTLGVDGGYSQVDVTELARALTGWTIQGLRRVGRFGEPQASGAAFVSIVHEPGARTIMGRRYEDDGARQALVMLDDLAAHPSTARFVATKLARHFAGDVPPKSLVARLEQNFLETDGDLASLTHILIDSPEVWANEPVKFRQPYEWLVASLRLAGIDALDENRIAGALDAIGQVPWRAPSPAGYDDKEASWAGPDALFRRVELAERIARGARGDDVLARADAAFPGALSDHTRTWLSRAESGRQGFALLLVAPEMMRR